LSLSGVTEAASFAIAKIRAQLAPLGVIEGLNGEFRAGHMPEKGPEWYSATVFSGLSESEIDELESQLPYPVPEQTRARIPMQMRELLAVANGMICHNLSIYGMYWRIERAVGAPIGLSYGQIERPPHTPKTWFGFGSMNGPWASQGELYLTENEEVVLAHRDTGDIGARWPSMADFLMSEVPRLLAAYDARGDILPGMSELPCDTAEWEAKAERAMYGPLLWKKPFRRLSIWMAGLRSH
jgi:hypothetical protein